jgi:DNA-binding CsgD family transcriptional regulator
MNENIKPITSHQFIEKIKIEDNSHEINLLEYFNEYLKMASHFATGPYFWFIPDNTIMKIVAASNNISLLSPFDSEYWKNQDPDFFASLIHEDDRFYVLSSIQIAIEMAQKFNSKERDRIKINIYGRLLNAKKEYRWTLIQFPSFLLDSNNKVISGIVMVTDMSHLNFINSPLMTIIDFGNNQKQYFKISNFKTIPEKSYLPKISKRENEILHLITRGLNSPQIAEKLFLSYHTVENHKRNLRRKTEAKTTAELIDYVWRNNLI